MEVALSLWIEDRNQKRVPQSGPMVQEKAKRLYAHFKVPGGSGGGECTDGGFQASEGWFNKFKVRQSLHSIKIIGKLHLQTLLQQKDIQKNLRTW
jgi:Tc5 transposase DNA-binding domain.